MSRQYSNIALRCFRLWATALYTTLTPKNIVAGLLIICFGRKMLDFIYY